MQQEKWPKVTTFHVKMSLPRPEDDIRPGYIKIVTEPDVSMSYPPMLHGRFLERRCPL